MRQDGFQASEIVNPKIKRLVSDVPLDWFPNNLDHAAPVDNFSLLGDDALEIELVVASLSHVVIIQWEVEELRPRLFYPQPCHDLLFPVIDPQELERKSESLPVLAYLVYKRHPRLIGIALDADTLLVEVLLAIFIDRQRRKTARVDKCPQDFECAAVGKVVRLIEDAVQQLPYLRMVWIARNHAFLDAPAFLIETPAANLIFQAVALHIHGGSQYQYALWQFGVVHLAAAEELRFVIVCADQVIGLPESRIDNDLLTHWIASRHKPLLHDFRPCEPRRGKAVDKK